MVNIGGIVSVGTGGSGSGSGSGIQTINSQSGPAVTVKGVNGIAVSVPSANCILLDTAALSGQTSITRVGFSFFSITSGQFAHNLGTRDVLVQTRSSGILEELLIPDRVIFDSPNVVSLLFNRPQTGRAVFVG